jgi:glycolate oxidase FAD binding subunit
MTPIPQTAATIIGTGTLAQALQLADDAARSPLLPAAIVLSNLVSIDATENIWKIAVWSEGFEETVARHVRDVESMGRRIGLGVETIREQRQREWWEAIREFPLQVARAVYRVTVPRASVAACVRAMQAWGAPRPVIVIDAAAGTLWVAAEADERTALEFSKLIALATGQRGHATLFSAPADLKERHDVWGPAPATLALMRGIKHQFDPKGLLNPGRFVAGL